VKSAAVAVGSDVKLITTRFDARSFEKFPPGLALINVARGEF
jgi:lactate dehydrogenase-like 2-hydroxyacid dehydrogenase